jgi:hypothetical protein
MSKSQLCCGSDSDSLFSAAGLFPPDRVSTVSKPQPVRKIDLLEAISPDNLKQDLLRCSHYPSPDSQHLEDYLHHFAGEYARTLRLLRVQCRWSIMNTREWSGEVGMFLRAINECSSKFTLWPELDEAIKLIEDMVGSEDVLVASDHKSNRVVARREMSKQTETVIAAKAKALEVKLTRLLATKGCKVAATIAFKEKTINVGCEKS